MRSSSGLLDSANLTMAIVSAVLLGPLLVLLIPIAFALSDSCISYPPVRDLKTWFLDHRFVVVLLPQVSHLQETPVDRECIAAPYTPPRAFVTRCVVPCAPSANRFHGTVVPLGTAPAAGAGGPPVNYVKVDRGNLWRSLRSGHGCTPPATVAYASDIRPDTLRSAFFPV